MGFKGLGGQGTSYIIVGPHCKSRTQGPLFRNYEEFGDGHRRALKQAQASSHKHGTLGDCTVTHTKPA